jgi:hypothetical protein
VELQAKEKIKPKEAPRAHKLGIWKNKVQDGKSASCAVSRYQRGPHHFWACSLGLLGGRILVEVLQSNLSSRKNRSSASLYLYTQRHTPYTLANPLTILRICADPGNWLCLGLRVRDTDLLGREAQVKLKGKLRAHQHSGSLNCGNRRETISLWILAGVLGWRTARTGQIGFIWAPSLHNPHKQLWPKCFVYFQEAQERFVESSGCSRNSHAKPTQTVHL